jgi:hypothetical protein
MVLRDLFEAYESCILTGQVPQEEVPRLLTENPDFAAWYRNRIAARRRDAWVHYEHDAA